MSTDTRTLREKLAAMAAQDVSPHEAEIARAKLATMGDDPPPPRPPTRNAAPAGDSGRWYQSCTTSSTAGGAYFHAWTVRP